MPNNSLRILIACGTAGSIAAAFNTPLAGVIFAMEVIIAEYTVVGFIPVILAAVSAATVSHFLSGGGAVFVIPPLHLQSLLELPYIILLGLCCGAAVALFIRIIKLSARLSHWPVALRFALAGIFTGTLALVVPQIMGVGYDTLNLALQGELALKALLVIAGCKLIATAFSCGMGLPVGLIGPNLLIGACMGGALGMVGAMIQPELASDPTLYIIIGMGAAMGHRAQCATGGYPGSDRTDRVDQYQCGGDAGHCGRHPHQHRPLSPALCSADSVEAVTTAGSR